MGRTNAKGYPAIDIGSIAETATESQILSRIVGRDGCLRASKPRIERWEDGHPHPQHGIAAYVWRMVAFGVSPNSRHHCMPCMAFCDLPKPGIAGYSETAFPGRRDWERHWDALADRVVRSLPASAQHSTIRWGRALGAI